MKKIKKELLFEGLGFPIRLINVPMRKTFGEWVLDIDLNLLQLVVLHMLAQKPTSLTGKELNFIRCYMRLSTHSFAKLFGVSHVAVLKWENEKTKMGYNTEICIRLYLLNYLKVTDKEFRRMFNTLTPDELSTREKSPIEVDAEKIAC